MATWKKVIVSGSNAQLATVTSSIALQVGTNQFITTSPATTLLSGSFSGSFQGSATLPALTQGTGISTFTYNGSAATTVAVNGAASLSNNAITKWNGTAFANSSLTDNGTTITGTTSIQLTGASSNLSGSFSGSFFGNGSGLTNIPYSSVSVPSGIVSSSVLAAGSGQGSLTLTTNGVSSGDITATGLGTAGTPTFAGLTISTNALAVNNTNGITTNAATFPIAPSATTINIGTTSNTAINLGGGSSTVTIPGNLTVNGTTTIINTTNTAIKDQFILLASGSTGTMDGGIIVGNSATINVGEAFYWENNPGTTGRWAIASAVDATSTTVAAAEYMVTAKTAAGAPSTAPTYGGSSVGYGNIYVDSGTGDVYIYS